MKWKKQRGRRQGFLWLDCCVLSGNGPDGELVGSGQGGVARHFYNFEDEHSGESWYFVARFGKVLKENAFGYWFGRVDLHSL